MPFLALFYYVTCHAAVAAGIALAASRAVALRKVGKVPARESRFLAFLAAAGIGTLGMTYGFLSYSSNSPDLGAVSILSALSLLGLAGCVAFAPALAACFHSHRGQATALRAFYAAAIALGAIPPPVFLLRDSLPAWTGVMIAATDAATLAAAVAYSLAVLRRGMAGLAASADPDDARWSRIVRGLARSSIVVTPLTIAFDLLGLHRALGLAWVPQFLPLLAALFAFSYAANSLHAAPARSGAAFEWESATWEGRGLSPRETEVARLLAGGYSYKGAAERLGISPATVKTHVLRVYDKTGAGNKLELLLFSDEARNKS